MAEEHHDFPDFSTDEEMIEWFDNVDFGTVHLDRVAGIEIADHVRLTFSESDDLLKSLKTGTSGTTGVISAKLVRST